MTETAVKHLEMIQAVVVRMAQNSFTLKGWNVTLVAASFALGAKEGSPAYLLLGLFPTLTFWGLDGLCLRRERLFRCHFDAVRKAAARGDADTDFSMDISRYRDAIPEWLSTCFSRTLLGLYLPMTLILGIAVAAWAR